MDFCDLITFSDSGILRKSCEGSVDGGSEEGKVVWFRKKILDCQPSVRTDSNLWIPCARRQAGDRVQELVYAGQQIFAILRLVRNVVKHFVGHDGGQRSADLVVAARLAFRTEQNEEKARGHRHFSEVAQHGSVLKAYEYRYRSL